MTEQEYVPEYDELGRELVDDGYGKKIPLSGRMNPFDKFTVKQRTKISAVYTMIAQALPVEGKDYLVEFSFPDPDGNPNIALRAKTEIGADFIRHLSKTLKTQ